MPLAVLGAVNFLLSWRLQPIEPQRDLTIDGRGALLISFSFSDLTTWDELWTISPSQIAGPGFILVVAALNLLAVTIRNDWSRLAIVAGLITLSIAQGCIVPLMFNTLLSSSPEELTVVVGGCPAVLQRLGQRGDHRLRSGFIITTS